MMADAPQDAQREAAAGGALLEAAAEAERDRDADDEQEEREDQVGRRPPMPLGMPERRVDVRASSRDC